MNTEEDDNDLNYFIIDQLNTLYASIESLVEHLRTKQRLNEKLRLSLSHVVLLNHRQKNLLLHFLLHPNASTSVTIHCNEYKVVRQTARTDLTCLEQLGFLYSECVSREFIFKPVPDLEQRINDFIG